MSTGWERELVSVVNWPGEGASQWCQLARREGLASGVNWPGEGVKSAAVDWPGEEASPLM